MVSQFYISNALQIRLTGGMNESVQCTDVSGGKCVVLEKSLLLLSNTSVTELLLTYLVKSGWRFLVRVSKLADELQGVIARDGSKRWYVIARYFPFEQLLLPATFALRAVFQVNRPAFECNVSITRQSLPPDVKSHL